MDGSGFKPYKVIVMSVDDLVYNLNSIRYDFAQLLYPNDFGSISYLEFSKTLGTEQSIYSFLHNEKKEKQFNDKIETFLYSEKNFKNIQMNENIQDLFKMFQTQKKKLILLTSHSHHLVKTLLKKTKLYDYVSQILSLSDFSEEYPSLRLFNALSKYYHIQPKELLVISSINSILDCVDGTIIDKMYIGNPNYSYLDSNIKVEYSMASIFEALEFGIHGNYTTSNLLNPILGFDNQMDDEERAERYSFLQEKYKDSPELLSVVEDAYYGNDLLHTTSFDTKAFKIEYEKHHKEKEVIKEEKEKEIVQNPKKNFYWIQKIFIDLVLSMIFTFIVAFAHQSFYPLLTGKLKEVYDGALLPLPGYVHALFDQFSITFPVIDYWEPIVECTIALLIINIIVDFIMEILKLNKK